MTSLLPLFLFTIHHVEARHAVHVKTATHVPSTVIHCLGYYNLKIVTDMICISCHANQQNEFPAVRKTQHPPPTVPLSGSIYHFLS